MATGTTPRGDIGARPVSVSKQLAPDLKLSLGPAILYYLSSRNLETSSTRKKNAPDRAFLELPGGRLSLAGCGGWDFAWVGDGRVSSVVEG